MKDIDQTQISGTPERKKVIVPLKGKFSNWISENRGKGGLAVGFLSGIGFISARNIDSSNLFPAGEEVVSPTNDFLEEKEGTYISINPGDSIGMVSAQSTFSDAFNEARSELGAGGIFEWNGNYYNTFLKEEWDAMSSNDKLAYSNKVGELINKEDSKIHQIEKGDIVTIEYNDESILNITLENSSVLDNVKIIQLDLNNDGIVDLVINADSFIKHPSPIEDIFNEPELLVDGGPTHDIYGPGGSVQNPIDLEPPAVGPYSPVSPCDISEDFLDDFFDGFPDIDQFNEEFLP